MDRLSDLIDARRGALSWRAVAHTLQNLEASASLAPDGQPWIRAAEAVSGYSANQLRRMSKALLTIDEIVDFWPEHAERMARLRFSHAEILARLWKADRAKVLELLQAERWPSYPQLLARYENARSGRAAPNAAGKLALGRFRAQIRAFLRREFGPELRDTVAYHPYVKPDFLVIRAPDVAFAWDCLLLPDVIDKKALRRRFLMWSAESTFVTRFWIVVQDDRASEVIKQLIGELDLANVGLLIPAGAGLHPEIEPHGPPMPDRSKGSINRRYWWSDPHIART